MKAPIGRMGGKSRLKSRLIEMFPDNYDTFVEPFVGAGNIFYSTPKVQNEIINDKDEDMYIIHKGLQQDADYINKNIPRDYSRDRFIKAKGKTDVINTIYRYKSSFFSNGVDFDPSKEGRKMTTDYSVYGPRLKDIKILNQDYSEVIKKYDSTKTFMYLDPPYEHSSGKKKSDYKHYVNPQDVYDALQGLKGKFMLSYNDSPNIRKIFNKYNIRTIKTQYAGKNHTVGVKTGGVRDTIELVITNY